jgi:two-component system, cell cycle sensor histidine kinase and response regulator CckA
MGDGSLERTGVDGLAPEATGSTADQLDRLRQALEQVSVMVVLVDTDARIQYVNPKFCEVTGFSRQEAIGMIATDLGQPTGQDGERMWGALRDGRQWRGEMIKRRKDGSTYWESATITAIRGQDGRIVQHVKVAEDVTERRAALEALRASEQKYRMLIEAAGDAIFLADAETGVLLEVNSKAEKLMGRPASELVGRHQHELHPPEEVERYEGIFREHARELDRLSRQGDVVVLRPDGTHIPVEITAAVVEIGGRKIVHGIFHDITERVHLEQQLRQAEKMQAIGQLAGGIAHDFNNRLVAILGFAELLARQLPDGQLRKYAERIVRNSRRAATLTGQLLAFARKANYQAVPVDLHAAIREVVLFLTHGVDKRIAVRMHLEAPRPSTLGDPTQLENALLNLALNARDAMPEGGTLTLRTANVTLGPVERRHLGLEPAPEGFITVAVSDTGTGMDEHVRAHLFEPFFTTKRMGEGTGMGLAAVYGTVQSHRGAIDVETQLGRGTTFTLYLPSETAEPARAAPEALPPRPRDARILVVDDEADVRELVRDMLVALGYQVVTCRDGVEAAELYGREWATIDLVVLDMVMPRLGGRATLARMRATNPAVKAILATGVGLEGDATEALREGALGFVQKPFALRELAAKVGGALEERK